MKYDDFTAALGKRVSGPLVALRFKIIKNDLFIRFNDTHEINVISVQKHSSDSIVSLNFGVHYDFIPKSGSAELPSKSEMELPDCEFKVRITPDPSQNDYWWPISPDSVDQIAALIEKRAESFFDRYSINGKVSKIVIDDLNENMPDIFTSTTKVRACLILARIQETLGNTASATAFAEYGIKLAGMAVGPKKILKDILIRIQSRGQST